MTTLATLDMNHPQPMVSSRRPRPRSASSSCRAVPRAGAIETLCRRSVEGTDAAGCVDEYIECLQRHDAMRSRNADKTFAHAYLAAMNDPLARVGEGALSGVWNFESPAFAALVRFLQALAARGT